MKNNMSTEAPAPAQETEDLGFFQSIFKHHTRHHHTPTTTPLKQFLCCIL